jgi:hypothetical protein
VTSGKRSDGSQPLATTLRTYLRTPAGLVTASAKVVATPAGQNPEGVP